MVLFTKANGLTGELKAKEYARGRTEENIKVYGKIIKNMDMGYLHGQTEENTKGIIRTIRSTELAHTHGQTDVNISESGRMTKDTVEESTS